MLKQHRPSKLWRKPAFSINFAQILKFIDKKKLHSGHRFVFVLLVWTAGWLLQGESLHTAPNTYRLDILATWRVFPEFNVELQRPYLRSPARFGGDADVCPPPPVLGADPSTRCRSCSSSRCATAGPACWCAGQAWRRRATRGSRSTA